MAARQNSFNLEVGPAYTHSRLPHTRQYQHRPALRFGAGLSILFLSGVKYAQNSTIYVNRNNTNWRWQHNLSSNLTKSLASNISFTLEYNSKVVISSQKHIDFSTQFSLVYNLM